jgi:hypothetical protein
MPKLDTTIDNLELKSNKVLGDVPSADWTDAQYPSAKTLYNTYNNLIDLMHPIGSILCVGENTSPANTLGGVWELVDKDFMFRVEELTSESFIYDSGPLGIGATLNNGTVTFSDHTVLINLVIEASALPEIESPYIYSIGQIYYPSIGLADSIEHSSIAIANSVTDSLFCSVTNGAINALGMLTSTPLAISYQFSLNCSDMPDELCNKFYFKRIA